MRTRRCVVHVILVVVMLAATAAWADDPIRPVPPPGSEAKIAPGKRYDAGPVRRLILGDTYRDLWATPIRVPVLDLQTFAGGLTPTKKGGGKQTKNLSFKNPEGLEYVFRLVDKENTNPPEGWEGTIVDWIARDQVSAHHPAGPVVADTLLSIAGVPHPKPILAVMPNDPALGEFRAEFAGQLGFIEPYPNVPPDGEGFAGAIEIIDSDSLKVLIDADAREQIDAHAYLTARLVEMFLNDWDRHPGNWKWAKMETGGKWQPIPRDRDKVLTGYGGIVTWGGKLAQELVSFKEQYPHLSALTVHSRDMDRRFLTGLGKSAFDSTGAFLKNTFTDSLIVAALRDMPAEYHATIPETEAKLKARRDGLPQLAYDFYRYLSDDVDIHATDKPERAVIKLVNDHEVDVAIQYGDKPPYYHRRFHDAETREVRIYMHGGDDRIHVEGDTRPDINVRVIGGNGDNRLNDTPSPSPVVELYEIGRIAGVRYGPKEEDKPKEEKKADDDKAEKKEKKAPDEDDEDPDFDRRPWIDYAYHTRDVPRDYGANSSPLVKLSAPGDLGLVPGVGLQKTRWGFRKYPYSYRLRGLAEYSTKVGGWRVSGLADKRLQENEFHWMVTGHMSELEVLNFYGFGNDSPGVGPAEFFEVKQRQWQLHPVVAYAVGTRGDIAIGPIVKYATTENADGTYLGEQRPYGFGDFGEAGIRIGLYSDSRDHSNRPGRKILLDLTATYYPKALDVAEPFGVLAAITATYLSLPLPLRPVLALKAGGRKVLGNEFPFHEAAFIGGRPSERDLPRERYAGDASLYGTAELRIPIARFALLLPLDTGVYVYGDAGRVYVEGESPGGLHHSAGVGAWIGFLSPASTLSLESGSVGGMSDFKMRLGLSF